MVLERLPLGIGLQCKTTSTDSATAYSHHREHWYHIEQALEDVGHAPIPHKALTIYLKWTINRDERFENIDEHIYVIVGDQLYINL